MGASTEREKSQNNFVSEWFGHRIFPTVRCDEAALHDQQSETCPFLSAVKGGAPSRCVKPERSRGVCTVSTTWGGAVRDWLVCPYRAFDPRLLNSTIARLFGVAEDAPAMVTPAALLANAYIQDEIAERLTSGERAFVYFDAKIGGELSIPRTARSPEFSFDETIIEIELVDGRPHVGRFGVLEIQTMDFHGSYGRAVRNLKDTLRMFPESFGTTLQQNTRLEREPGSRIRKRDSL